MKTNEQKYYELKRSLSGRELTPQDLQTIKASLRAVRIETKHPMFGINSESLADQVVGRANYWLSIKEECPDSQAAKTPMVDYIKQMLVADSFFGWSGYLDKVATILSGCDVIMGRYHLPR